MTNNEIILVLLIGIVISCKVAHYYYKQYKINYSNYQMCLMALANTDPSLKLHLAQKELANERI